MKDIIEDVLETVRLKSAVYFKHGFCGNWGMDVPHGEYAQFHFVVGGNCFVEIDNDIIDLSKGDLLIFPHGKSHRLKANANSTCIPGKSVVFDIVNGEDPFEDQGEVTTNLICGHYELERSVSHFIISDLPDVILVKNDSYGRYDLMDTVLNNIIEELSNKQIGFKTIMIKYAEILFISVLRHYYLNLNADQKMNLFNDEPIYRSINFIHNNLNSTLNLNGLSHIAGLSRTLFIERFKKSVGKTPLSYIKEWRMTKAKQLLMHSDLALSEISSQVGYNSSSAFNRVFKDAFDMTPNRFRHRSRE